MDELTREQHIFMWKTQGGNYTWAKWASMHGIPVRSQEFHDNLTAAQPPLPTYKPKRRRRKQS